MSDRAEAEAVEKSILEMALEQPAAASSQVKTKLISLGDIAELPNIRPVLHDIEGLAATMHLEGQLQPCVVRASGPGAEHGKPYELIFGYRRKAGAELLGWEMIRCEIRDVQDGSKIAQMIIENFQREQLSPVAEARAMYGLKHATTPPLTNVEVASKLGCDPSQISHRLRMLEKLAPPPREIVPVSTSEPDENNDTTETSGEEEPAAPLVTSIEDIPGSAPVQPSEDADGPAPEPERLDILGLVDSGKISASAAEVVASLDDRREQEKLAALIVKQDWGVKKAAKWANDLNENKRANEEYKLISSNTEMLEMSDVIDLPKLTLSDGLSAKDIARLTLYMQLRSGMDYEVTNYIEDKLGFAWENLWGYVVELSDKEVTELSSRLTVRFVTACHRLSTIEPSLRDRYEDTTGEPDDTDPSDFLGG